jgi:hypothetical protein
MVENNFSSEPAGPAALRHSQAEPRGVLHGNLKMVVYLGAALLVVVAAVFSAIGKKNPAQAKNQPPQPMIQDNTDSNAQELKSQIPSMQPPPARPGPDPDYAPGGRFSDVSRASLAPRRCSSKTLNALRSSSKNSSSLPRRGN